MCCLPVLLACLGAVLQGASGTDEGYVFLSGEQESFVAYQTESSTNWSPSTQGSLYLNFRTSYKDGLLAFAEGPTGQLQLWLEEGTLRVEYSLNGTTKLAFTVGRRLNTDATFRLELFKNPERVTAIVHDSANGALHRANEAHDLVWDLGSYVYVGGVRDTFTAKVKAPANFIGCISDVRLSSAVDVASASVVAQSGVKTGNCTSYTFCKDGNKCARALDCVNLWNDSTCDCRTAPKYGPTCNEHDFSSINIFGEDNYFCTNLALLTEPAFQALENVHFVVDDVHVYSTTDPRLFLYLTSNANPDTGVAVVGFYNESRGELQFEAKLFFNGTVASTGTVSYFASISMRRYSDELVIGNSVGAEQGLTGLENLADLELDRLCIGGGAPSLRRPSEGRLSRLFVNGINIFQEGRKFDEVNVDLTSVRFLTPESIYTVEECPQNHFVLQFSFVTYDQDGVLAVFTTNYLNRSLTFSIVDSEFKISLGNEDAVLQADGSENAVPSFSDGRKHLVTMFLLPDDSTPDKLEVLVAGASHDFSYLIAFPPFNILTVCTNGMTFGEDFVGCIQDLKFAFGESSYNFSLEGLLGVSNRKCNDPCVISEGVDVSCDTGICQPLSETEYRCPGVQESSSSSSSMVLPTTTAQSTSSTTTYTDGPTADSAPSSSYPPSSYASPSPPPPPSPSPSPSKFPSPVSSTTEVSTSPASSSAPASTSASPTDTTANQPNVRLGAADIAGIAIGGVIGLCIGILIAVIVLLACLIIANRRGYYPTKEASVNESTLLRHNASLRSVSSTRPLHSQSKREIEYYI